MLTSLQIPWAMELEDDASRDHQISAAYEKSRLDHFTRLEVDSRPRPVKLTGIMVTLGVTNSYPSAIADVVEAGASMVRLNMSHGTDKWHVITVRSIREAGNDLYKRNHDVCPIGVAIDLCGPEIRTGSFRGDSKCVDHATLVEGSTVRLLTDDKVKRAGTSTCFWISYEELPSVCQIGDTIIIDRGAVYLKVICIEDSSVTCEVIKGGTVRNEKSVQLVGATVPLPMLSERDCTHINFASNVECDFIIVNQTRSSKMIRSVYRNIKQTGSNWIRVLAKISSRQGLENFDEVLQEADGIVLERAGLELELGQEKLFLAQKSVIAKCNKVGKPVVIIFHPKIENTPRVNLELVANAVLDGVDTIFLATGSLGLKDTVKLVKDVDVACREAESARWQKEIFDTLSNMMTIPLDTVHSIAIGAIQISLKCNATAIIITTTTGRSAVLLSIYRPRCPIVAVTRFGIVARYLRIYFAVHSVHYRGLPLSSWPKDIESRVQAGMSYLRKRNYIEVGDAVVVVGPSRQEGQSRSLSSFSASSYPRSKIIFVLLDLASLKHRIRRSRQKFNMRSELCMRTSILLIVIGVACAAENYVDYADDSSDKSSAENIHELYRLILQRNALENGGFGGIPLEHLMIRKSQRSPSLRLRFGRSGPPHVSAGLLSKPMAAVATGFDENN
ncbi:hypothetical protein KPH14_009132 [Odynerus spinipes]|uniref:Pyruvate kinase n=1 Tax=Odynerus spinipes TaxID=1348599 RepID=A0AAD9RP69_9HYME|nr:hypothetical protein KPH14_009132 [Odynerus spinipes]